MIEVRFSAAARSDMLDIVVFIARDNPGKWGRERISLRWPRPGLVARAITIATRKSAPVPIFPLQYLTISRMPGLAVPSDSSLPARRSASGRPPYRL